MVVSSLLSPQDLKVVNSYLKSCFLVFPNYNLGHGLMEMAYNEYINEYYAKIGMASCSLPPLLQGMWRWRGPQCWHIPSACPVGVSRGPEQLGAKSQGGGPDGAQKETWLRVSSGVVPVLLKVVPWAIPHTSPMGRGGCEP